MFLFTFLKIYGFMLLNISPILIFLLCIIVLLGLWVARLEGWTRSLGVYCAFITATTVGYGVVHPTKPKTRVLCIVIAFIGLIVTGIIVALAYQSMEASAEITGLTAKLREKYQINRR